MPKELTDILANTNPWQLLFIILALFMVGKWFYVQGADLITAYKKRQKDYHLSERAKELAQTETEQRFKKIEDKQDRDYHRIKDMEAHLYEIQEQNIKQNEILAGLDDSVRDLRIQSIRKQILDFYPVAINLSVHPSREAYQECIRNYETYEALMEQKNEKNGYLDYSYSKILDSMVQRETYKLYAENFVILPSKDTLPQEKPIVEGFEDS